MKIHHISIFLFAILMLASCSSTQYISDSLGEVEPSAFSTYTMEDNCADDINPIMQIRIKNALEKKLRGNNYTKSDDADILIKYLI